jgi:oxygen-independent coproporphyrinogen III oxidase
MAGIYIHIPFCKQACIYCNFYFEKGKKNQSLLVDALIKEIELRKTEISEPIKTVYFGGGTPSYLDSQYLEKIINAVHSNYNTSLLTEVTLEANPDDIDTERLINWKSLGINRLSIGVQSFYDSHLKWMNRAHNSEEAESSIKEALKLNFEVSIDLIFGIPDSTHEQWLSNLNKTIDLGVHHISCYGLTLEPNTPWEKLIKRGQYQNTSDGLSAEQFEMADNILQLNHYEHYEISNYALKDKKAKHNSSYWAGEQYIGIGPSAHSFNHTSRSWNISDIKQYIESLSNNIRPYEEEQLSKENRINEYLMTSLRTSDGIIIDKLNELGIQVNDLKAQLTEEIKKGFVLLNDKALKLSPKGMLYADAIASKLFV